MFRFTQTIIRELQPALCQSYNINCNIQVAVEAFSIMAACCCACVSCTLQCTVHNTHTQQDSTKYATIIKFRIGGLHFFHWGTRWRSWLRHCATNRKVSGPIPDGVTGTFHWHNPSGRTMALRSTQPLTEMSTRNISWGVKAAGA